MCRMIRQTMNIWSKIREARIEKIAEYIPEQTIESGPESGDLLIVGWGSTFGAIESVVRSLN